MKQSLYFILILFISTSCSTSKEVAHLDETLAFADDGSAALDGVDFNDSGDDFKEFEVSETDNSSSSDDVSFSDFENPVQTQVSSDESGDLDFSDFESSTDEEVEVAEDTDVDFGDFEDSPGEDLAFPEENEDSNISFESPLDITEGLAISDEPDFEGEQSSRSSKIESIDYNAFHSGGSFLISTSEKADYSTEFIPETNQYVVKLKNTVIDRKLSRPFLTKDFRQSFEAMNSYSGDDGSVRLVFQLKKGSFPKVSFYEGKLIVEPGISLASNTKKNNLSAEGADKVSLSATSFEDFLLDKSTFVGQPVSLQVKDESIVTIIQFIAEQVGANIVLSSGVTGNISIKLKDVPWDQALVTIMKAKGLGYVRSGNILRVAPLAELQQESVAAAAVQRARQTLAPFHVKVFPLSYASPAVVEAKIKPFLTVAATTGGRAGQAISEARSSSLIIRDTFEVIQNVTALVKELDRAPLQVMIQAKIVEATKSFSKDFRGLTTAVGISSTQTSGDLTASAGFNQADGAFFPEIRIGGIDFLGALTARLRLQEIDSKAKVLSSPSVLVINNEKATILQSDEVLNEVRTTDATGQATVTTERTPVTLSLDVTPQVSADSNIIMEIEVKRQFPEAAQPLGIPISTREAKTKVIIGNNRTAMIGGIYQVLDRKNITGAPVLRKIPLLGWLFRSTQKTKRDTELVIFVTPRVMNQGSVGDNYADQKLKPSQGESVSKF